MFHPMLRGVLSSRATYAPEIDDGQEFDDGQDEGLEGLEDGDEGEGEVDPDSAEEGEGQEAPARAADDGQVRQPSRAQVRIQQALRDAKDAKERADALERRLADAERRQTQETPAQRNERLAMMEPEERLRYEFNEGNQALRNELAQIRFESQERSDRAEFEALCARTPAAARVRDQVEDRLAEMRRSGTTAPRATVLRYILGDRLLAGAGKAAGKARRTADTNLQRQTGRPGAARGDVANSGRATGSEAEQRRKRLEDMQI